MILHLSIFFLLLFIPLGISSTFAAIDDFTTDKSVYYDGDIIRISGTVSSDLDAPAVSIVIFDPARSTFVTLGSAIADSDGNFSTTVIAGGGLWTTFGTYPIQVTSEGTSREKSIEYRDSSVSNSETPSESSSAPSTPSESSSAPSTPSESSSAPKTQLSETEPLSGFVTLKLKVSDFPSLDKAPQYYLDRYNNEPKYKAWFDSQFPGSSIHNVLGYSDPVPIPDWIRDDAEKWATGTETTSEFVTSIEFMLERNIIVVPNIPADVNVSEDEIPFWIRNNAYWWSQNLISEEEFVSSLEFLLEEEIISVN